jgi:hypothetical protein
MIEWLKQNFELYIEPYLIVYNSSEESITTDYNWLSNQLGNNVPPTYEGVKLLPIYSLQGWEKIIDQWKERGLIQ